MLLRSEDTHSESVKIDSTGHYGRMCACVRRFILCSADYALSHYNITPTNEGIQLQACGRISFAGVAGVPSIVRELGWMIRNMLKREHLSIGS